MRTLEAAPKTSKVQMFGRILLGLMLVYTGVSHLTLARQEFQAQVPPWIPLNPDLVVFLSGFVEITLGLSLLALYRYKAYVGLTVALFFCGGLPRQHRSIYRAPRCVWPEHRYGAARPSLLSAPSCCLGALVYGRLAICYWFMAAVCRKRYCENGALEVADEECPYAQRGWR